MSEKNEPFTTRRNVLKKCGLASLTTVAGVGSVSSAAQADCEHYRCLNETEPELTSEEQKVVSTEDVGGVWADQYLDTHLGSSIEVMNISKYTGEDYERAQYTIDISSAVYIEDQDGGEAPSSYVWRKQGIEIGEYRPSAGVQVEILDPEKTGVYPEPEEYIPDVVFETATTSLTTAVTIIGGAKTSAGMAASELAAGFFPTLPNPLSSSDGDSVTEEYSTTHPGGFQTGGHSFRLFIDTKVWGKTIPITSFVGGVENEFELKLWPNFVDIEKI